MSVQTQFKGWQQSETFTFVIVTGTASNTKTGFTQLLASTAFDYNWVQINLRNGTTTSLQSLTDIAIGAAGAEKVIIPNTMCCAVMGADEGWGYLSVPLHIPQGSRISARMQTTATGTASLLRINTIGMSQGEGIGVSASRIIDIGSATSLSGGATLGVATAYRQLTASLAESISGIAISVGSETDGSLLTATDNRGFDLAIGAAGAEKIIWTQTITSDTSADWYKPNHFPWSPCAISAGTRLAARRATGAGDPMDMIVYGTVA